MPRKKKEAEELKEVKKPTAKKVAAKAKTAVKKETAPVKKAVAKKVAAPKKASAPSKIAAAPSNKATVDKAAAPQKATAKKTAVKKVAGEVKSPAKKTKPEPKATKKTSPKTKSAVSNPNAVKGKAKTKKPAVPTVRYSDEDLEMFANVIQESRREALDELRMLKERLEDLTNYDYAEESMIYSMHMAEQGSEAMEKEKTYAQIQRINEYLKKLDEGLNRIKDKTYGICRVCNCLIAKERLLAVPVTTLSASYKIHQRCPEDGIDRIEAIK